MKGLRYCVSKINVNYRWLTVILLQSKILGQLSSKQFLPNGVIRQIEIKDALWVPKMSKGLLSVPKNQQNCFLRWCSTELAYCAEEFEASGD